MSQLLRGREHVEARGLGMDPPLRAKAARGAYFAAKCAFGLSIGGIVKWRAHPRVLKSKVAKSDG